MTFVNDFSPFIFSFNVGGNELGLRWYGMAYVLGFFLGFLFLKSWVKKGWVENLTEKKLDTFIWLLVVGVVGGGRLGFCLQHLDTWLKDPLFIFKITQGGMAFFGGLGGVIIVSIFFARKNGIRFGHLADALTIPAALALGFGRIANFINAELWGIPTGGDWGVIYPNVDLIPRHPSEIYESTTHFLLALVLWISLRFGVREKPGMMSGIFVLVYGLLRTVTEKFRTADTYLGPLTNGQVASLVIALIGIATLVFILKRRQTTVNPTGSA